jgi:flagellar protein FliL
MSAPATAPVAATAAPAGGKKKLIVLLAVGLMCSAAGAAVPMFVEIPGLSKGGKKEENGKGKSHAEEKTAAVPFGDVMVNLVDERMSRYLRIKIAIQVDASAESEMTEMVTKHKAAIKSKLISHIAGKTLKDVSGSVGVARLQRELLERIEDVLFPDGGGHVRGVLFEEYVVQ